MDPKQHLIEMITHYQGEIVVLESALASGASLASATSKKIEAELKRVKTEKAACEARLAQLEADDAANS